MGREIKRVPLDFDWPLRKVWGGFLMPSDLRLPDCPDCKGGGMNSHDSINRWILVRFHINRWILVRFRCKVLGIPENCPRCHGEGNIGTDEQRKAYEEWAGTEPPIGDGWQIWETVSEGSPVSPVFPTKDALIAALVADGHSVKAAENFVESSWAPSMVMIGGTLKEGIHACEDFSPSKGQS